MTKYPDFFKAVIEQLVEESNGPVMRTEGWSNEIKAVPSPELPPWLDTPDRAPWLDRISDEITEVEEGQPSKESSLKLVAGALRGARGVVVESVDTIAVYKPYHYFGRSWGIYVYQEPFLAFSQDIADACVEPWPAVVPFVRRQILEHEWTHFDAEVAATQLEDIVRRSLYVPYRSHRFAHAPLPFPSPLEEALATSSEVRFARGRASRGLGRKPAGFARAVEAAADAAPPGYRDWRSVSSPRDADVSVRALCDLILGSTFKIQTARWWPTRIPERRQVPLYWVGNLRVAAAAGFASKTWAYPSIRLTQRWLRGIHAQLLPDRGAGSHQMWELPGGRRITIATKGWLLPPEAKQIASLLGVSVRDLCDEIRNF